MTAALTCCRVPIIDAPKLDKVGCIALKPLVSLGIKAVIASIPLPIFSASPVPNASKAGAAVSIRVMMPDRAGFSLSTIFRPMSAMLLFSLPLMVEIRPEPVVASFSAAPPKKLCRSLETPWKPFCSNSSAETLKPNSFSRSVSPILASARASIASLMVLVPPEAAAMSSASFTKLMASLVSPLAIDTAREPAAITSPVSNGVALAFSRSCWVNSSAIFCTPASSRPLLVAPMKCFIETCWFSSCIPLDTTPPSAAVVTVAATVMGMAAFAKLFSLLLIFESPAVTPSFSLTIGVATILPTALTLLATDFNFSVAISLMATAVTILLRSGCNRRCSCCAARFAAVASSRAVRRRSQVDSNSRRVRCTSRRNALCSCLTLRSTADILSLIEIEPLTPIGSSPPTLQMRTSAPVPPRQPTLMPDKKAWIHHPDLKTPLPSIPFGYSSGAGMRRRPGQLLF